MTAAREASDNPLARRLPGAAFTYTLLRSAIDIVAIIGVAMAVGWWLLPEAWRLSILVGIGVAGVITLCVDLPVIDRLKVRNTSYDLDRKFVRIRRGVLFVQDTVLPVDRILSVSVLQGPLLRRFDLAKVRLVTIADGEPLGPLRLQDALQLRDEMLQHGPGGRDA